MASVKPRTTANGERRYDVRYRTPAGDVRCETFRTRKAADQYASTLEVDLARGGWVDPRLAAQPFGEWAAGWLAANPGKRSSSRARDEVIIRLHLATLAPRALNTITPRDVQALVSDWSAHYAATTVHRHYETLHAILAAAVETDHLARNPCRGVKLPKITRQARHVVSADELATLAEALPDRYYALPYVAAVLGLRWGECAGLRVGRLDILARTVTVAEQRSRGEKGRAQSGAPKSDAGARTLAMPRWLAELLAQHLAALGLTAGDAGAYVFTMPGGGPLDYSRFRRKVWIPGCVAAGLGELLELEGDEDQGDDGAGRARYVGLTFHDLRRASISAMVHEGVDVGTAKDRAGHSDVRLTLEAYRQASTDADRVAAKKIGRRFRARDRAGTDSRARWTRDGTAPDATKP
jgi:integrase